MQFIDKFETLEYGPPIPQYDFDKNKYYELDIYNCKNEKGNAINILLEYLHLDKNCAMCFGDGRNDFSMFRACKYKVAMINGNDKLKESANFITEFSNEKNGVARFIEKNLLS